MAASDGVHRGPAGKQGTDSSPVDDSSESDGETEPAKSFHRKISTNKNIKCSVCTKEGYLNKQTSSFQRWRRRYFKLKGRTLYYGKDTKSVIFDEIQLTELSVAQCSIKNANHSFQVITPFRSLVLCAETRRDMEEWIAALRAATRKEYYESGETHDFLSGQHNWYATSHARPTYCNVCREVLSGVTSHGLSCEVCKFKAHKRCAVKALNNCKWTTLASVGKEILEDEEGNLATPHQWVEGNLPVSAKCLICDKTCGSVLRLQDWRCLWCRASVHTACRPAASLKCPLGPCRVSIVPPTALHSVGSDEAWEAVRPQGTSPLLVFVNSKSGDNQGVKFLRRFKQLLNPAQVFDLMNGGPGLGLRLFRHFDPFRILICSGDGSIGWVLSEIDKLQMHKQCQVGVLPLGTGNDLARVLGWGSVCDDEAHLPQLLHRYETASVKMLDRWAILVAERNVSLPQSLPLPLQPLAEFEDSVLTHLTQMMQSDQHAVLLTSAKVLCQMVKDFIVRLDDFGWDEDDAFARKIRVMHEKLDLLLYTLNAEVPVTISSDGRAETELNIPDFASHLDRAPAKEDEDGSACSDPGFPQGNNEDVDHDPDADGSIRALDAGTEDTRQKCPKRAKRKVFVVRDGLVSRVDSLKKAVRQLVEQAECLLDEQTAEPSATSTPSHAKLAPPYSPAVPRMTRLSVPGCMVAESGAASEPSPCASPLPPAMPSLTTNFPFLPAIPFASSPSSPQPSRPCPKPQLTFPEHLESEGEEEQAALLSLQAQLQALSPLPESESLVSTEFDLSGLALPVPLEFADTDSLTNNVHLRRDREYDEEDSLAAATPLPHDLGPVTMYDAADDEPNEVEEKPIPQFAAPHIELLVEAPSPEESTSQRTIVQEEKEEPELWPALGERFVEGAETPPGPRPINTTHSPALYRGSTTPMQVHARLALPVSTLLPAFASSRRSSLEPSPTASRRISTGSVLLMPSGQGGGAHTSASGSSTAGGVSSVAMLAPHPAQPNSASPDVRREKEKKEEDETWAARKRKMPIINPLVALPMWPNVEGAWSGGLIRQALLANADALCAAASPLMDLESDDVIDELYEEKCVMNSYFGIGIDAKITLDFHMKREEHPEKCRSRARNYMWYGVLGSKEWLQKTYKNLEQRVLLECDGTRIPLPSLQGIVVLNIPSFMGGTNFWGGTKDDDIFRAPSFDDRILEVVAVFGSVQMAASRIINLQHHRIAQCHSVKITVLGDEGVPVQVDGEAWLQPPGIIRLRHRNRMQMLCRNRALERSLETWQEKQQRPPVTGASSKGAGTACEEPLIVGTFVDTTTSLVHCVRLLSMDIPGFGDMEVDLCTLAFHAASVLDKVHAARKRNDTAALRSQWMDLVHTVRQLQREAHVFMRDRISLYQIRREREESLSLALSQVDSELRRIQDTVFLSTTEEVFEKKGGRGGPKSGVLSKLKFRKTSGSLGRGLGKVYDWSAEEVGTWLASLSLSEYQEAFSKHDIRGPELLALERRDLKELGVTKIGHIKRLQQGIRDLKQQQEQ